MKESVSVSSTYDKFLKAALLGGIESKPRLTTIIKVGLWESEQDKKQKILVHFHGIEKGLLLNVVNARYLAEHLGDEANSWVGKKIVVYVTLTPLHGEQVECVRVRMPKSPTTSQRAIAARDDRAADPRDVEVPSDGPPDHDHIPESADAGNQLNDEVGF
jgi:hypothetical protein